MEIKGEIIAFVHISVDESALWVENLAVGEEHQGKGVAGDLMRWAETVARANRCTTLRLWSVHDKVSVYEKLGYTPAHGARAVVMEADGFHFLMMEKPVPAHDGARY